MAAAGRQLEGQALEEYVVSAGARYGEQPHVSGNLVIWQRYWTSPSDKIEAKDLTRPDGPVLHVAYFPASSGPLVTGGDHLVWGTEPVSACRLSDIRSGTVRPVEVIERGFPVAVTAAYVFVRTDDGLYAKAIDDIERPWAAAARLVARFRNYPYMIRAEAASDRYFVWQDCEDPGRVPWRIYAKRIGEIFTSGAERLVADTNIVDGSLGSYLDLHDGLLVFQGTPDPSIRDTSIYLTDLDGDGQVRPLATTERRDVWLSYPAVSKDYVVWTEVVEFFGRTAYALRLDGGEPDGAPFRISSAEGTGSWLTLDRGIVAWNGGTVFVEGEVVHEAIIAAELPLPDPDDVGDVDQDGSIRLTDAVLTLDYLFRGGWRPRLRLADADGDGRVGLSDAIRILDYLFRGGGHPGT